jgi:phage anti-repressor protein
VNILGRRIVSARELHAYLGSERDFTNWMKYQIVNLQLIKDKDYSELLTKNVKYSGIKRGRGRPAIIKRAT